MIHYDIILRVLGRWNLTVVDLTLDKDLDVDEIGDKVRDRRGEATIYNDGIDDNEIRTLIVPHRYMC